MARRRSAAADRLEPFDTSTNDPAKLRARLADVGERVETALGELIQLRGQVRIYLAQLQRAGITPETLFPL